MKPSVRKTLLAALLVLVVSAFSRAVDLPKIENVQFPAGKDTAAGSLACPEKPGRYPALIVVHEWWGLNQWVKDQTQKLAAQGFVALAVDLYGGKVATDASQALELRSGLSDEQAIRELSAAYDYLGTRKDVDRDHVGAIGWDMGATYVLRLAIHQPRLAASVVNYGALPTDPNDIQQIFGPILGNFGANDGGVTPADVHMFEKTMKGMHKNIDLKIYDGAGHSFENSDNAERYRPEAASDAWARTVAFLNKTLK